MCESVFVYTCNAYERSINLTSAKPWILLYFFPSRYFYEILRFCLKEHIWVYKSSLQPNEEQLYMYAFIHMLLCSFNSTPVDYPSDLIQIHWHLNGALFDQSGPTSPEMGEKGEPPFGFQ